MPHIGQSVWHDNRRKTIVRMPKNNKGETIIEWESQRPKWQVGTCTTFLWNEWRKNIDEKRRRGLTVVRN